MPRDRVYLFEDTFLLGTAGYVDVPMGTLQALTVQVWAGEEDRLKKRPPPEVVATKGCWYGRHWYSAYYHDLHRIELARHQRSVVTLLHELAHALARSIVGTHGPNFQRTYLSLLVKYGGYDRAELMHKASSMGMRI